MKPTVKNPLCHRTSERATMFCYTKDCKFPAFGCSEHCLIGHQNHKRRLWVEIAEPLRIAIYKDLQLQTVQILEKYEKQIKMIAEELNLLLQKRINEIQLCRRRLQLNQYIQKLISCIHSGKTENINGNDMAELLQLFEKNNIFQNKSQIDAFIMKRNEFFSEMLEKISIPIFQFKNKLQALKPEIQLKTKTSNGIIQKQDGIVTVSYTPPYRYYPIMLKKPLRIGDSYQVQIVKTVMGSILIGLGTEKTKEIIGIDVAYEGIWINTNGENYKGLKTVLLPTDRSFQIYNGNIIKVLMTKKKVQWFRQGKQLLSVEIQKNQRKQPFYPTCWVGSEHGEQQLVGSIRFLSKQ